MEFHVTRLFEWDSAHRVLRHESKCSTLHGHRYKAEVMCRGEDLDAVGRVIDFGVIKEKLGAWIDERWDHTTLVNAADVDLLELVHREHLAGKRAPFVFQGEPTAENIARELLLTAVDLIEVRGSGVQVIAVRVWETPNCWAEAKRNPLRATRRGMMATE